MEETKKVAFLTVKETAERLRVPIPAIHEMLKRGTLPHVAVNAKQKRIPVQVIEAWERGEVKPKEQE